MAALDWRNLRPVPINSDARDIWATEVNHLTPWVIDNLALIGESVGLVLDPATVRREVPLGHFYADIMVHDQHGRTVVIENQFGPSDHDHFARLMIYACEASAHAVIWIVAGAGGSFYPRAPIRPEHKRALAKLNIKFADDIAFYGLAIELEYNPDGQPGADLWLPRLDLVIAPQDPAGITGKPPLEEADHLGTDQAA